MSTLKISGCMSVVKDMSDLDRDALLARLDQYRADGVPVERAQVMAAADTLAELEDERREFMRMLKEQHPEIFVVTAPQVRQSADRQPLPRGYVGPMSDEEREQGRLVGRLEDESYKAWNAGIKEVNADTLRWLTERMRKAGIDDEEVSIEVARGLSVGQTSRGGKYDSETHPYFSEYRAAADKLKSARAALQQMVDARVGPPEFDGMRQLADFDRPQVRTPEFRRWFKDSKVVDDQGRPLIVFHGTNKDLTEFATVREDGAVRNNNWFGQLGSWFAAPQPGSEGYDVGSAEATADTFAEMRGDEGSVVYPAYLSIQNPYEVEGYETLVDERDDAGGAVAFRAMLVERGYDGVVVRESSTDGGQYRDDWVAFYPTQIKSAIGNTGAFDPSNPDITKSADRTPLGFYSALARSIDGVPIKSAPSGAWKTAIKGLLNKGAIKQDELEWSGLEDWMDLQQGKISKEQVAEYLEQGGVRVEETVLGTADDAAMTLNRDLADTGYTAESDNIEDEVVFYDPDGDMVDYSDLPPDVQQIVDRQSGKVQGPARYGRSDLVLPGGENYREVLLTLPSDVEAAKAKHRAFLQSMKDKYGYDGTLASYAKKMTPEERAEAKRLSLYNERADYRSSHWDQPNVLAHIRVNDRTDADGNRVLFVEELQSDWGQQGKKKGFDVSRAESIKKAEAAKAAMDEARRARDPRWRDLLDEYNRLNAAVPREDGVPSAPFVAARKFAVFKDGKEVTRTDSSGKEVKQRYASMEEAQAAAKKVGGEARDLGLQDNTEGWLNLALKRVMIMAAEGGYDKVAFVNGEQSADRYDLSKRVDRIDYDDRSGNLVVTDLDGRRPLTKDGVKPADLPDIVGKEVADRLMANPDTSTGFRYTLQGNGLKVGGKGMIAFYDTIVPTALKKLLPKVGGGQMATVSIGSNRLEVLDDPSGKGFILYDRQAGTYYRGGASGSPWSDDPYRAKVYLSESSANKAIPDIEGGSVGLEQPGFDVTDAMREKVAGGLPLFSPDRFVQAEDSDLYKKRTAEDVRLISDEAAMAALKTDATSVRIMDKGYKVQEGELVGARLNLNVLKNTKVPVMTLHKATNTDGYKKNRGFYRGEAVQYQPAVTLRNAYFNVDQTGRENIATGTQNKFPMASVDGEYVDTDPNFDGVEVSFNPMRVHLFVDANGYPVRSAEEISMFGSRAYARGKIEYYTKETAPTRKGEAPSEVKLSADRLIEDIPNDDWLQGKIDYAKSKGRNQFGVPFMGAITGYFKGPVDVSLRVLSKLKGERDEQNNVRDQSLDYIRQNWDEVSKQPPYIEVAYNGEAWVSEGNHRIMVAAEKGLESMPVEIRYFDGGQRMSGPLAPGRIPSLEAPDIFKSADRPWFDDLSKFKVSTNYQLGDLLKSSKKLNWWNRNVGTQYNLAQKNPEFKRVFDAVQTFINDVSAYAARAADLAPTILPKLETLKDLAKSPLSAEDVKALRDPIFGGTLKYTRDDEGNIIETDDVSTAGVVFTNDELRDLFGLNDRQVKLYREFRRATNKSLSDLAVADMLRYLGKDGEGVRQRALEATNLDGALGAMVAHLDMMIEQQPERAKVLEDSKRAIKEKAGQAIGLMARGYAPLSRFGQYTVYVVGKDGEQIYFSMFETQRDANKMAREMQEQYPEAKVTTGIMSQESYKLFSGVTPETLALFGESLGLEESGIDAKSEAFQQYLKMAKTNRSAMKRLIQRKGIDGFSEDAGRVLAGFVYSNARQISTNLHAGEIGRAASEIQDGDVKDHAIRLMEYIQNPTEEAQALKGLLFNVFLGGNISSALVNISQTATTTFPYLSQFDGAASVMKRLGDATKLAVRGIRGDDELRQALKRAEDEGVVSPQEVFHLMAQAQGKAQLRTGDGTRLGDALAKTNNFMTRATLVWGRLFSAAEQANRRIAFIAAYKLARDKGMENPFAFAEKTVLETQFSTNKGIRPVWARGPVGGVLFTFKGFTVAYLELLGRMLGNGPEGRKAFGLALGTLFLFAGAGGLPFLDDLDDAIDAFAQRVLNKSFDSRQAKREFFASLIGQTGADFVMSGISGLPGAPIDVSGRLGLGNIIPGTGILPKKSNYQRDVMEVFGPAGSLFSNYATAVGMLAQGEVGSAAMTAAPVGFQNVIKGMDMAQMGFYRDTRGRKVIDTNGWEAVAKSLGFQPSSVKRIQDATSTQQGLIAQNKLRETEIADKMAKARIERKPELAEEAREELADWNRKNPQSPIRIDAAQINRRVQQAMMDKAKRIEKTAPQEIRADVKRELERAQ